MEIDDWPEGMNLAYEYTEIEETQKSLLYGLCCVKA